MEQTSDPIRRATRVTMLSRVSCRSWEWRISPLMSSSVRNPRVSCRASTIQAPLPVNLPLLSIVHPSVKRKAVGNFYRHVTHEQQELCHWPEMDVVYYWNALFKRF